MRLKSLTLTELLVVVIIISIVVGITIPSFSTLMNRHRQKEAEAVLNMIGEAETVFFWRNINTDTERNYYYPGSGNAVFDLNEINSGLGLRIPQSSYWNYSILPETEFPAEISIRARRGATICIISLSNGNSGPWPFNWMSVQ